MSTEFWSGLLTLPALIAVALILWALYSVATKAWQKLHVALLFRLDLRPNLARWGDEEDRRPKYLESANKLRDVYQHSPRLYVLTGLGWHVAFVRDTKSTDKEKDEA